MGRIVAELPPGVTEGMLDARFWLDRAAAPDQPFVAPEAISLFNARVHAALGIPPVLDLPETLDAALVRQALASYQPLPPPCYDGLGAPLGPGFWDRLLDAACLPSGAPVEVRFALAARRTDVRVFPTRSVVTTQPGEIALDRLQETTIDLGWPVAAVAATPDGAWQFCLTPHYWGWVPSADLAWADREQALAYARPEAWATITASRAWIGVAEGEPGLAQMGTRLPLLERTERGFRVLVPRRENDGTLAVVEGLAPSEPDSAVEGDLPCTPEIAINQAFRALGEPYAWGGSRAGVFGRDCSRLVRDAYAVSGLRLPRNGSQQATVCRPVVSFAEAMDADERRALLIERVLPGALLVMRGHIMLYLGALDGNPFVIHSTLSSGFDGVIVSDLSLGEGAEAGSLLHRLTAAVVPG